MSLELIGGLVTLFAIAAIGAPVAFAIIVGVVVYLGIGGQDIAMLVKPWFSGFLMGFYCSLSLYSSFRKYYERRHYL